MKSPISIGITQGWSPQMDLDEDQMNYNTCVIPKKELMSDFTTFLLNGLGKLFNVSKTQYPLYKSG